MLKLFRVKLYYRDSVKSYATFAATYLASFTLAHVFLKATDLSLETTDGLLKWSANEKVYLEIVLQKTSYRLI